MKDWLADIIEQLALGEYLGASSLGSGKRFGLIAVDNAVEYMMIAYVESSRMLVGAPSGQNGIAKKLWETTKREFDTLVDFVDSVAKQPAFSQQVGGLKRYHKLRNDLYHSGKPATTSQRQVTKYSCIAQDVLAALFQLPFTPTEWQDLELQVSSALGQAPSTQGARREVRFESVEGVIRFSLSPRPTQYQAIVLCLDGLSRNGIQSPSYDQLIMALTLSGFSIARNSLTSRIKELRVRKWISNKDLRLISGGKKEVDKRFILSWPKTAAG